MFVTLLNSLKVTNYIPKKIVNKEMSDKYKHTEASNKYSGHAHSQNLYSSSLCLGMVKTCYFPLSLYPKPLGWTTAKWNHHALSHGPYKVLVIYTLKPIVDWS